MAAAAGMHKHKFKEWLKENEYTLEQLFLDLENVLRTRGLLRTDFTKYRTHHFAEFCRNVFRHSSDFAYDEIFG